MFRVYAQSECGSDNYPFEWHKTVKHLVREQAGHRCVRCMHPYRQGVSDPIYSPCDARCTHDPRKSSHRVLTVHHLRLGQEAKRDLRWWNLVALCQRCHLKIQGKVQMERIWPWPHSEWFKPYAAGWYAWSYLGEDLTRSEVDERLDELLALELVI